MALAHLQPLSEAKRYGIVLPRELGDGKQLLPSAAAARRRGWALHPAGAVGPAAKAPSAPRRVGAAPPAPTLLENHYPTLALLNRYIGKKSPARLKLREGFLHLEGAFSACPEQLSPVLALPGEQNQEPHLAGTALTEPPETQEETRDLQRAV